MNDTTPKTPRPDNIFQASVELNVPFDGDEENWFASEELVSAAQGALDAREVFSKDEVKAGKLMAVLFDDGLSLASETDFTRLALLSKEMTELSAFARDYNGDNAETRRRGLTFAALGMGVKKRG